MNTFFDNPVLPLFLGAGVLFGGLAAASAFVISYDEYRRRRLRPGQSARRMAIGTAAVTFAFFFIGSLVLSVLFRPPAP